ncbi:MAG: GNAT family N-acetyltransferase [Kutzneria sp.]|nr:GNAT family N-acetyltransferase [Kutzneria sp.]MBV9847177.1 GNAT family N-acetyltransferase [Kutzneria sp.]
MILRAYQPSDLRAVYDICLATARQPTSAEDQLSDPDLLGHVYAGPYLELQPELAFVIADEDGVAGYVLGALDSAEFYRRWRQVWSPRFTTSHPEPAAEVTREDRLAGLLHHPWRALPDGISGYPSHLHVDLLARARRRGWGTALLRALLEALSERSSPGVHLITSTANAAAVAFYAHLGFEVLGTTRHNGVVMGSALADSGRMESPTTSP